MGEQLEARKDEALTAVEEAIYGALKRADLLREVGPFLRQILALEALGAVLSVVRAESGQPSSVPSSPHETGLTAEQKARIEGLDSFGFVEWGDSDEAYLEALTNSGAGSRSDSEGEGQQPANLVDSDAGGVPLGKETGMPEMPLDAGIRPYVEALQTSSVETFESCEGGEDHAFLEPTIRFFGNTGEGFRALGVALGLGLPVAELRREWPVLDGEPTGPYWSMTFSHPARSVLESLGAEAGGPE